METDPTNIQSLAGRLEHARLRLRNLVDQRAQVETAAVRAQEEVRALLKQIERAALGEPAVAAPRTRHSRGHVREATVDLLFKHDAMQAGEIAQTLGVPASTVYALLNRLLREGLVEKLEDHHWGLADFEMARLRTQKATA